MDFYLTVIEEDQDSYFLLEDDNSVVGEKLIVHAHSEGYNDFQGMGWTLVLEHATSEIFAPIVEQKNLIAIVTGIMIGVLLFIAFLVYRSISKPVSVLVNRVTNITDYSNLDQKARHYSKDEIGKLSRTFDLMIEKLKKTTTSIDKLNVEITERLHAEKELEKILNELTIVNEKLGVVGQMTRHDARNKLSVITNYVYLARKSLAGDSKVLGYLDRIEQAAKKTVELFEFSKLYEQLGVEELRLVDVGECVEKAFALLSGAEGVVVVNECNGLEVMADSLLQASTSVTEKIRSISAREYSFSYKKTPLRSIKNTQVSLSPVAIEVPIII